MDIKTIFKSLAIGGLLASAAIILEILFLFYEDDIIEISPEPVLYFLKQEKTLLLQAGVFLFIVCLCLLLMTTTYVI